MNHITRRSYVLLGMIAAFLAGFVILVCSFVANAGTWATSRANRHLYSGGQITNAGDIVDRNGTVLATSSGGKRKFNSSAAIRKATLHTVGDTEGYIATGAHTVCRSALAGYSIFDGIHSLLETGNGSKVTLTINAELCKTAYNALNGKKGAIGVYNYKTGEIVCMVSAPTYDPQSKPKDIDTNEKYEGIYLNRFLRGVFTPGSTFKLITATSAIENIPDIFSRKFTCTGSYKTPQGGDVICNGTHGTINFGTALTKSCNCAFAQIGIELGADKLEKTAKQLGFGERLDISGVKTSTSRIDLSGTVEIDLGWAAIGQYTTLVNPCHMMTVMGAIASGGQAAVPRYVLSTTTSNGISVKTISAKTPVYFSPETAATLKTMMRNNVINNYGDYRFPQMQLCAKTGTAQVSGEKSHAWFTGFSSNENFPYAFTILVENGGGGSDVALPIASTVMKKLQSLVG